MDDFTQQLPAAGVVLGTAGSLVAGKLLQGAFPHGGIPLDVYLRVVPALFAVTMLAAYIPARRAARVDPVTALRAE